jgi:hypothetical protein
MSSSITGFRGKMIFFKHRYLLIPLLVLAISYVIDKILLLENIQTYYTKTVSEINFFHKPLLLEELKDYLQKEDRKKVLVYFGNSRALLFDNDYIEKKYPDWILFNFSVPGGSPDYFLFWLEKFEKQGIKPDFVLLDNSVEAYNKRPLIKIDECLANGFDFPFMIRYASRYTQSEISSFTAKRLFRTYQYRPKLDTILSRMKNDFLILNQYREWRTKVMENLIKERGSASSQLSGNTTSTEEFILKYAEGDYNSYLTPYEYLENTELFQRDNLSILKKMGVPHAGIWVRVAPAYFKLIKEKVQENGKTVLEIWKPSMDQLHSEFGVELWNMNEDPNYNCNAFTDASHMGSACFPDYTDFIFERLKFRETSRN